MTRSQVTIKQALASHPLAPAVLRQLGGGRDAVQSAIEAGEHGADAGWPGFTYSADCVQFAKRHRNAIATMASDMASEIGDAGAMELVKGFRCLKDDKDIEEDTIGRCLYGIATGDDADTVYNALAWFALEEVGRAISVLSER